MTEWIEWAGGECPIPDAKAGEFEIKLRDGTEEIKYRPATTWRWVWLNDCHKRYDIIAYRLIEKEQSDLDWLEDEIVRLENENIQRRAAEYEERSLAWFDAKSNAYDEIFDLILLRREVKS